MLNRLVVVNHYCHKCRQTTRHEIKGEEYQCPRCRSMQHLVQGHAKRQLAPTGAYPVCNT